MKVTINHANATGEIRHETFQNADHLVAPATAARAMTLNGGYVPQAEWQRSAAAWNGTPVTLNHPTDEEGRPVIANRPTVAEETWFGHFFNVEATDGGEFLEGEMWFNLERASEIGGDAEDVITRVENGEPVDVSTAYFADPLEPGEYDGEHREQVVGNLRPDHLAALPNEQGKCDPSEGCGVPSPAATTNADGGDNADAALYVTGAADDPGTTPSTQETGEDGTGDATPTPQQATITEPDYDGTSTADWTAPTLDGTYDGDLEAAANAALVEFRPVESFSNDLALWVVDGEGQLNRNALESAWNLAPQVEDLTEDEVEQARSTLVSLADAAFDDHDVGPADDPDANALRQWLARGRSLLGLQTAAAGGSGTDPAANSAANEGAESPVDPTPHTNTDTMNDDKRQSLIDDLVENHGFSRDSAEALGDSCLQKTHEQFETDAGDDTDPATNDDGGDDATADVDPDAIADAVAENVTESVMEQVDDRLEEFQREQTADQRNAHINTIVENSAFEEDDLEDKDLDELETLANSVAPAASANYGARVTGNAGAGGEDDLEKWETLVNKASGAEAEGGD